MNKKDIMEDTTHPIMFEEDCVWSNGNICFENGDGTRYQLHMMPAKYGGVYIIANEKALYRYHGDGDIKFLCGVQNDWTERAILQIIYVRDFDRHWSAYL